MADRPDKVEQVEREQAASDETVSWRRIGEFVRNVLEIERSVRNLRAENKELRTKVDELQRMVDDHNGQLRLLSDFVRSSLDERVERRAEEAATRTLERFMAFADRSESEDHSKV